MHTGTHADGIIEVKQVILFAVFCFLKDILLLKRKMSGFIRGRLSVISAPHRPMQTPTC